MFAAWTILGSITLVTSLNSRTCSPATAAVEAAIKLAAPNRNLEKQVRLLGMIILPRALVTVSSLTIIPHLPSAIRNPHLGVGTAMPAHHTGGDDYFGADCIGVYWPNAYCPRARRMDESR